SLRRPGRIAEDRATGCLSFRNGIAQEVLLHPAGSFVYPCASPAQVTTEDERLDLRTGKPVLRIQIDRLRPLRQTGLVQAVQQTPDVSRVLEHEIPLRDQLICPS